MSDYKMPELPSDEELGIDDEDLEKYLDDDGDLRDGEIVDEPAPDPQTGPAPPPKALEEPARTSGSESTSPKGRSGSPDPPPSPKGAGSKKSRWARRKERKEERRKAAAQKRATEVRVATSGSPETDEAEKGTAGSRSRWRGAVALAILVGIAWVSRPAWVLPVATDDSAPDSVFSSGRAMVNLREIASRPHPPGSPEHARVRDYLVARLVELGLSPEVDTATVMIRMGSTVGAATVRNVLARIPGTASTGVVLLTAHYDGRGFSPAAGDDGFGVVTILESLRALSTGPALRNDVIVLLTDAEELGLLGARAFVAEHPWFEEVSAVLSFEMRGGGGLSIMFETGTENGWMVRQFQAASPAPWANSFSEEVYRRLPRDTDFTPFKARGVQGLNFAGIGRANVYHQSYDTPDNVDERTLQHHGIQLLGLVRRLGGEDLSTVAAPNVVFFRLPGLGLIVYPLTWVVPISVALLLLAVLVFWLVRRRGAKASSVVMGFFLAVMSLVAAFGAGFGLWRWVQQFHSELGALQGSSFHREGWYVLALGASSLAIVTSFLGLARRRYALGELVVGAALVPLGLTLFLTFFAPLSAMNLQWPLLSVWLAVILVSGAGVGDSGGTMRWLVLLALAVPVLAFLAPLIELVWLAMSLAIAPGLAVLMVLVLLMILPQLDALREPNGWWAPLLGLGLAGAFLGLGVRSAGSTADRPAPSTLLYALDHDSGEALWATLEGPGFEWAQERIGPMEEERVLDGFVGGGRLYRVTAAPAVDAASPLVVFTRDTLQGAERHVRLEIRSQLQAEELRLTLSDDSGLEIVAVNGRPLTEVIGGEEGGTTRLVHWGEPVGALNLDLVQRSSTRAVTFDLVEVHHRPVEVVGETFFQRPPTLAPDLETGSDVALFKTRVTVPPLGSLEISPSLAEGAPVPVPDASAVADTVPVPMPADTIPSDTSGVRLRQDTSSAAGQDTTALGARSKRGRLK